MKILENHTKTFTEVAKSSVIVSQRQTLYTVRFMWSIAQPIIIGDLKDVVAYAIATPNNGIEHFAEITNIGFKKINKKTLKGLLSPEQWEALIKIY